MPDALARFTRERYFNLETFRRDGTGVRTPLWFVEHDGELAFYTMAGSGKVKRLRRNPQVRVAPCGARGGLRGDWIDGTARPLDGDDAREVYAKLNRKYGWQRRLLNVLARLARRPRVTFAIRLGTR
jgi:PPOX class probable F420-dependent enzyme